MKSNILSRLFTLELSTFFRLAAFYLGVVLEEPIGPGSFLPRPWPEGPK